MESTICSLISAADRGDPSAAGALFAALYGELHRLARYELVRLGGGGVTLGATTLLHEAYLNMAGRAGDPFPDRARFMAYAARVMRGLIIDCARRRHAAKRGGGLDITSLDSDLSMPTTGSHMTERIGEVLDHLEAHDPLLAEIVDLKFFCGFSFAEIAAMRGTSERTVQRHWERARIYLHAAMRGDARSR